LSSFTSSKLTGSPADLDEAVHAGQAAAGAVAADDLSRPGILANLANELMSRYARLGDPADLDRAVEASLEACGTVAAGDPDRPAMLIALSNALGLRAERMGSLADLDSAADAARQATGCREATRALAFSTLGLALMRRYQLTGSPADLDEVIAAQRQAVGNTPEGDPARVRLLADLGDSLRTKFESAAPGDNTT